MARTKKTKKVKDPVCDMEVEGKETCTQYKGKEYRFCSDSCRQEFEKNPAKYVK